MEFLVCIIFILLIVVLVILLMLMDMLVSQKMKSDNKVLLADYSFCLQKTFLPKKDMLLELFLMKI